MPVCELAYGVLQILRARYAGEIQPIQLGRATEQVDMALDEARQHRTMACVNHPGLRVLQRQHVLIAAYSNDFTIAHRKGFRRRLVCIKGDQLSPANNKISFFRHASSSSPAG